MHKIKQTSTKHDTLSKRLKIYKTDTLQCEFSCLFLTTGRYQRHSSKQLVLIATDAGWVDRDPRPSRDKLLNDNVQIYVIGETWSPYTRVFRKVYFTN